MDIKLTPLATAFFVPNKYNNLVPLCTGFYNPKTNMVGGSKGYYINNKNNTKQTKDTNPEYACTNTDQNNELTCFNAKELIRIAQLHNIPLQNKDEIDMTYQIHESLKSLCGNNQACWTKGDDQLMKAFKAVAPNGQFTWLNTTNLNEVMERKAMKHPDFKFLGTVAIDFEQYDPTYKYFSFNDYPECSSFGCIFNTDRHYESGQHWIAMYFSIPRKEILFFDSYGNSRQVPPEVNKFAQRLKNDAKKIKMRGGGGGKISLKYRTNPTQFQRKNSECGVYCLYFLHKCIDGMNFDEFIKQDLPDNIVNQYRTKKGKDSFFRPTKFVSVGNKLIM